MSDPTKNKTTNVVRTFPKESSEIAKGVAILLMLFYHLFSNAQDNQIMQVNFSPLPEDLFLMFAKFGNICVSVFVFLTAFGISTKLFATGEFTLKDAYRSTYKRAGKLFLNFFLVFVIVNLLWFKYFDYALLYGAGKQGVLAFLADALSLSHFFGTPTLNMTWWYMSIAYTLVFLVPFLAYLCKKTGYPFLAAAFLIPFLFPMQNDISRYFFVMAFGITAAYGNWFEKVLNCKIPIVVRAILEIAFLVFSVFARENEFVQTNLLYLADAFFAFGIILFAGDILAIIPGVKQVFAFLGHYSMDMYFTHTFFYLILYRDYIFRFRYAGVTFLLLVIVTLLFSVFIELIKKLLVFLAGKISQKKPEPEGRS